MRSAGKRVMTWLWPGHPVTVRGLVDRAFPSLVATGRLTLASVVAYLITTLVLDPKTPDLTGTLTALLVMQASARGSFKSGLVRVVAVLTGVAVALVVTIWWGLSWWSLAIVIFWALFLAKILRLGDGAMETAISGMLILGSAGQPIAVETRVLSTLLGAAVGMVFPLLLPPTIPTRSASGAVRDVSRRMSEIYRATASTISAAPVRRDKVADGLAEIRDVSKILSRARSKIGDVRDRRKWNSRAFGVADVEPLLQSGVDTLERCTFASRALFLAIAEEAPEVDTPDDGFGEDVRAALAEVLADVGECLDAFGALVESEVSGLESDTHRLFESTVAVLNQTRGVLTDLMRVAPEQTTLWTLRGSILASLDQILQYLDVEARVRTREDWKWSQVGLRLPADTVGIVPTPRELRRHRRRVMDDEVSQAEVQASFIDDQPTEMMPLSTLEPPDDAPDDRTG